MWFLENYGKCDETQRYQNCNNQSRNELFSVRTKLLCNKKKNSHNLLAIRMKITQIIMNKQVFLGLSMLDFGKIVMYEYWNDYEKRKYGKRQDFVT